MKFLTALSIFVLMTISFNSFANQDYQKCKEATTDLARVMWANNIKDVYNAAEKASKQLHNELSALEKEFISDEFAVTKQMKVLFDVEGQKAEQQVQKLLKDGTGPFNALAKFKKKHGATVEWVGNGLLQVTHCATEAEIKTVAKGNQIKNYGYKICKNFLTRIRMGYSDNSISHSVASDFRFHKLPTRKENKNGRTYSYIIDDNIHGEPLMEERKFINKKVEDQFNCPT